MLLAKTKKKKSVKILPIHKGYKKKVDDKDCAEFYSEAVIEAS